MLSELRRRLAILRREKVMLSIVLPLYFCTAYFALQRMVIFPQRDLSPSFLDEWIAFSPGWTAVYQSLYLFIPLPWLCTSAAELRRYRNGFLAMTAVAFLFFFFLPVAGPRPVEAPGHVLYRLLIEYDRNLNAFPSLHVAITMYTLMLLVRLTRNRAVIVLAAVWAALIVYSTMAIKQHWAADVAAGVVLAVAADLFTRKEILHAPPAHRIDPSPGLDDPRPRRAR